MTDDEVRALMRECHDRLLSTYPFAEGSTLDPRLAMAMGAATGALREGLDAERDDRKLRFDTGNFIALSLIGAIEVALDQLPLDEVPGALRAIVSRSRKAARDA